MYNIFIFGIAMKLIRLIKMCVNEVYSRVRVGKHLSDMFLIRNGSKQDALSPLFFNFVLAYAIRKFQISQDGSKLSGTHQLLVYADDVSVLGGSVHTVKKNAEALVVASKETGIEVNANKTKCMFMSRDQDLRLSHNIKTDIRSFDTVERIKIFGNKRNEAKFSSGRN